MSPELQAEFDRRLVGLAFPDWESKPGDRVETRSDWSEGYRYSEYTGEPASMEVVVTVKRADYDEYLTYGDKGYRRNEKKAASRTFTNEEAAWLWGELMGG